jgi:CRP-like cAMP-binding protein
MNKKSLLEFIQGISPADPQVLSGIADQFGEKLLSKNDFFLREGQLSNEYLFLEMGFIRAFAIDIEGQEVTTNFYSANQVVMEVASFFNLAKSRENMQCLTDCRGYVLTYHQLNMLFHTIPAFRDFGRAVLVRGFVALKQRTLSLISETAEERYAGLLQRHPEIFQYAPLKFIASYLGVTDSSLSRIRRDYSKKV